MNLINGPLFGAMLKHGYLEINNHVKEVNDLNVFPVPDGDTGINMVETIKGGVRAIENIEENSISKVANLASSGMLFSARGNSGVILSQFFAGIALGLDSLEEVNPIQFSKALEQGVEKAYKVVDKPVEGTILTVMREGSIKASLGLSSTSDFKDYFEKLVIETRRSLKNTPELLPILKEAGVIDSGGAGLVYIIEGMSKSLGGDVILEDLSLEEDHANMNINYEAFNEYSELDYGYCTEFILQLLEAKKGPELFNLDEAIRFFSSCGDSLVCFREKNIVKVHVHTKSPSKVIDYAQQYGEFIKFKLENMALQHNSTLLNKESKDKKNTKHYEIATCAVSTKAFASLFKNYNITHIIESNDLMNPKAEDFLNFFNSFNAGSYLVLPNNKNEILAVEQAIKLCPNKQVYIIPTFDIYSGLAVASILDSADLSIEENLVRGNNELEKVMTFKIVKASKTTSYKDIKVKENDYLAIINGELIYADSDLNQSFRKIIEFGKDHNEEISLVSIYLNNKKYDGFAEIFEEVCLEIDDFLEFINIDIDDESNAIVAGTIE